MSNPGFLIHLWSSCLSFSNSVKEGRSEGAGAGAMAQASALSRVMLLNFFNRRLLIYQHQKHQRWRRCKKFFLLQIFAPGPIVAYGEQRKNSVTMTAMICLQQGLILIAVNTCFFCLFWIFGPFLAHWHWIDQRSRIDSVGRGKMGSRLGQPQAGVLGCNVIFVMCFSWRPRNRLVILKYSTLAILR